MKVLVTANITFYSLSAFFNEQYRLNYSIAEDEQSMFICWSYHICLITCGRWISSRAWRHLTAGLQIRADETLYGRFCSTNPRRGALWLRIHSWLSECTVDRTFTESRMYSQPKCTIDLGWRSIHSAFYLYGSVGQRWAWPWTNEYDGSKAQRHQPLSTFASATLRTVNIVAYLHHCLHNQISGPKRCVAP
jgi:hypothetical protein